MGLGFYIKKIKDSDLSRIKTTAKSVSEINGKPWPFVYVDIINCTLKYGSGHVDYKEFKMYEKDRKGRENVLTIGKNNKLVKQYNDMSYADYFDDKVVFNKKFAKYISRDWMILNEGRVYGKKANTGVKDEDCVVGQGYDEFLEFIGRHEYIMIKPVDLRCGKGIEKIHVPDWDPEKLYEYCVDKAPLLEEVIVQDKEMQKFSNSSVNTVRIVTILDNGVPKVVAGSVRMGQKGSVVDNFNAGGISTIYNIYTGEILCDGYDKDRNVYETVPDTGIKIKGNMIPRYSEMVALVKEAALIVPEIGYVGWDVCLQEGVGPILIEGNSYPGPDSTQNVDLNVGTMGAYMEALRNG